MSFASLKKKSGTFDKLTQQIEKMSKPQGAGPDERLWKPGVDKSGNGYAVIRFLPEPDGEEPTAASPPPAHPSLLVWADT